MVVLPVVLAASVAQAQNITGTVQDGASRAPVRAALITLTHQGTQISTRVLADSLGRFVLRADSGNYILTAEQLGYQPTRLQLAVTRDAVAPLNIVLSPAPLAVSALVIRGTSGCSGMRDPQLVQLWYRAPTTVGSASAKTQRDVVVRKFTRELDLHGRVLEQQDDTVRTAHWRGFETPVADSVLSKGFVQQKKDGTYFFAPDADVLLSDGFVEAHCFRLTAKRARDGLIGIEFQPKKSKGPSLHGTLWMRADSAFLSALDFSYRGLGGNMQTEQAGGRIDFARRADNSWVISNWVIRMPRLQMSNERQSSALQQRLPWVRDVPAGRVSVAGIVETGGQLLNGSAVKR